jgi:hypothetical protein
MCMSWPGCGLLTGDLVLGVLLAVLALAVGTAGLGNVDLSNPRQRMSFASSSILDTVRPEAMACNKSERGDVANAVA